MKKLTALLLATVLAASANAFIVDSADVNGLKTFEDVNTGRTWLDMDNFFNATSTVGTRGFDMIAIAEAAGFTFATKSDVEALLNSLPLVGTSWSYYASVMGYGVPRQLIWGMYDDGDGNDYGYAWAWSDSSSWAYIDNGFDANTIASGGSYDEFDMGLWAYKTEDSAPVPDEGSTLALLGFGLIATLFLRRKR